MLLAVSGPEVVELTVGYLLFLPILVALLMPWRTWTEARWLTVYGLVVIVFWRGSCRRPCLPVDDRQDVIFALLVALSSAFTGHVLAYRQRVRTFAQVRALGRLQRRETRQRAELERVHHSLEITARLDELTGTGNRIKLHEDLRTARAHLDRTGVSFGMLEVDLDHFKAVNDAFGHLAGDEVLRLTAAAMRDALRTDDAVYRYGGEEFIILLGTVKGGVLEAGERLRHAVEALQIAHPGEPAVRPGDRQRRCAVIGPVRGGPHERRVVRRRRRGPVPGQGRRAEPRRRGAARARRRCAPAATLRTSRSATRTIGVGRDAGDR